MKKSVLPAFLISFLVVVFVLLCLVAIFVNNKSSKITSNVKVSNKSESQIGLIYSPINKASLNTVPQYASDSGHLVFFLDDKEPVLAVFDGVVSYVSDEKTNANVDFANIIIVDLNDVKRVSYLLAKSSEILVTKGMRVKTGEVIAKVSKEKMGPACLGGANLGVYLFVNDKSVNITKEMLKF